MKVSISGVFQLLLVSFLGISVGYADSLSITSTSFIDEIADSPAQFMPTSRADLLTALNEGDLVSMGETHETGLERTYIAGLYTDLITTLNPHPIRCLIEATNNGGDLLTLNSTDPVRPEFNKVCATNVTADNPTSNYGAELSAHLSEGRVLTHTGYRHTLPFALMYPADFATPQWVDIPEHGTITKQVPDSFVKQGKKMRTHIVREADDLIIEKLSRELVTKLVPGAQASAIIDQEAARVAHWAQSPAFQFKKGEVAHILEISRVHQSFDYEHAYMTLLNRDGFSADLLVQLLKSSEFAQLVATAQTVDLQMGVFIPDTPGSSFGAGSVSFTEMGTIYAYAPNPSQKGALTIVSISPSHGPLLEQSTF